MQAEEGGEQEEREGKREEAWEGEGKGNGGQVN